MSQSPLRSQLTEAGCLEGAVERPKVVRTWCAFHILISACASRRNSVHFFDILTSKSAPRPPVFNTFDLRVCFVPKRRALFRHLNFEKCPEAWGALRIFTSKCASRHNDVHFLSIATSKSAPICFSHFDFEMCFAPQPRVDFGHFNFQKCSEYGVFCACWLGNMLRATAVCTFSTSESELPEVLLTSHVLRATTAYNLASVLFDPPEPQNLVKQCFATFLPFRPPASSFYWFFLFSDSSHLCFSICPKCRKFDF